jgi:hypothetical protein
MDAAAFDTWLGAIALLTDTQRQRALLALSPSHATETAINARD